MGRGAISGDGQGKGIARRTCRRAVVADGVDLPNRRPQLDDEARHMTVARLYRIAMFDLDRIAVAAEALVAADGAVGGGVDRGAVGRRNVDAVVARDAAGDGMNAHPDRKGVV